jgi:Ca2+-binding EF-hand superfamily protein
MAQDRYAFAAEDEADAENAKAEKEENIGARKAYDKMTPEEVFREFDTDGSGAIDWAEFKAMLPKLGVNMNDAKALKYFNMCDTDGGGDIDIEEFRSALFAVDPNTGNTTGFQPSSLLTPQDAFELFDVDKSGSIDEDEFAFVLEYMNVPMDEFAQEKMFQKYDKDGSGAISYDEFKQIWLKVCNVKKELDDRDIKYPKFSTRSQLESIMERVLDEEEEKERHALAEADQFKRWQRILNEKKKLANQARRRSLLELRTALDLAGQVYTFGTGAFGQFSAEAKDDMGTKNAPFTGFKDISNLWLGRVVPERSFLANIGNDEVGAKKLQDLKVGVDIDVDDPRTELLYSPFNHSICAANTASLWGRRITSVALAASVAVAVSELGEVFVWGGTTQWWHQVEEESIYRQQYRGVTTARSSLLLQTGDALPPEDEVQLEEPDPEEEECVKLKDVLSYFGAWKPPPVAAPRLAYYKDTLFPLLDYGQLAMACGVRG